ncbi:MAG TPA: hypothetical protein VIB07_06435 [Nitrososphaera sp.]|jgi:hypothetical protein
MKSVTEPNRLYKWIGVSMIAAGTALLLITISGILNPPELCQDYVVIGPDRSYSPTCEPTIYPGLYLSSADAFIMTVLSLCLAAFGGVIVGMIIRLQK